MRPPDSQRQQPPRPQQPRPPRPDRPGEARPVQGPRPAVAGPVKEKEKEKPGRQEPLRKEKREHEVALKKIPVPERAPEKVEVKRPPAPKAPKPIAIPEPLSVKELADKLDVTVSAAIKKLISLGVMATINQEIDVETAQILATEFGYEVQEAPPPEVETPDIVEIEDDPETLRPRPPVVTVMGHVDHGKTSLLDAIRQTNVTAQEAGGITQHIGAYTVEVNGRRITFLDTPGHEAFTAMRARGARATDIAVLVVAADDGVMPQTVEAINHAKAAGVPILVAVNKIDRANANPERVRQQLTEYGLVAEEWGGDTIFVNVSAKERIGLDQLMEMILILADVQELNANPDRPARGIIIEAEVDKGRGPVATVLIQAGTLRVGDSFVAGQTFGKVRAMIDDKGRRIKKAGPSTPVEVTGLSDVPRAGDTFQVVADEKVARDIATRRQVKKREEDMRVTGRLTLDDVFKRIKEGEIRELNLVIKADVQGSVEAVRQSLEKLTAEDVRVNVIHGGVGAINESDVMLASASGAIIIGFNVQPDVNARRAAEREAVDIRSYRIIYEAVDDVKAALQGMLKPRTQEVVLGRAEVRATFKVPKVGVIAGSYVTEGKVVKNARVRLIRDGVVIHEGRIESLRRFKDDAREVAAGFECGIGIEKFNDIKEGDAIEVYAVEEVKQEVKP